MRTNLLRIAGQELWRRLCLVLCLLAVGDGGTFTVNVFGQAPGTQRWAFKPELTGTWSGAAIGPDGTVYVSLCQGTGGGAVYALAGGTGTKLWQFGSACSVSIPAIGADGTVYVAGGDSGVYALNGLSGATDWTFQADSQFESSPAIGSDGTVYIGCDDHKIYALDGATGAKRWDFATGGAIHESAAIGRDGTVYVGSTDGSVYALDGATGGKRWVFGTGGPVICSPAIGADGTIYIGSADHNVYALDGAGGGQRWQVLATGPVDWSPAIADDMVVIGSNDGGMYSLDIDTGEQCWSLPVWPVGRAHPVVATDGFLYFGTTNLLVSMHHITKDVPWVFTSIGVHNSSPTVGPDGTVFVGSDNGPFYAIWSTSAGGLANSPWPMAGQNVRRTGLAAGVPLIFNQPVSQAPHQGATPLLSVIAVGAAPLSFQWAWNGAPLARATNAALALTNFQAAMSGDYTVVVTNSLGVVTSQVANVTIGVAPSITAQPQNQTGVIGGSVSFGVVAVGSRPLSYQWQFNSTNLPGANDSTLSLTNLRPSQAGAYRVVVSNVVGNVTSPPAMLALTVPPAMCIQRDLELTLAGAVGAVYRIEYAPDLGNNTWVLFTNLTLTTSPVSLGTPPAPRASKGFYRARLAQ